LGALLALLIFALLSHRPLMALAEALLPLATTVSVLVWLACWLDGVAYGPATTAWWGLPARDEWGTLALRVPLQFLGAALTLGLLGLVDAATPERRRLRKQVKLTPALLWAAGFSGVMLGLSFLRADPAPTWYGLRLDAWAALFLLGVSLAALILVQSYQKGVRDKG
jgi:hypothetical protein